MIQSGNLVDLTIEYNREMPERIRRYLRDARGIPDAIIDRHLLGWNGWRITIPIFNRKGELVSFRLAKDPEDRTDSPKMLATPGSHAELYGWEQVLKSPPEIVICEGEFDRLVLEAQGFPAVTSTGGAGTFRSEWASAFEPIPKVYLCFDRDDGGRKGALRAAQMIPYAKLVELPEEVGEGGDVTDFFVRLGRTAEDFRRLFEEAQPAPPQPDHITVAYRPMPYNRPLDLTGRIEGIKNELSVADVIGQYLPLRRSGNYLLGRCPLHEDRHPSFAVYPASGTFYCFGCGKHGDVITFVREIEHLSFHDALDVLDGLRSSYESRKQEHR
jgi:DNA primase